MSNEKPVPTIPAVAEFLVHSTDEFATRYGQMNAPSPVFVGGPAELREAAAFGFVMGVLHGTIVTESYDREMIRKAVYSVLQSRFKYTEDEIATDIIGG